jgi:hypothetical protein
MVFGFRCLSEAPLGVKRAILAGFGAVLLAVGSASLAADYRPDEFLNLDLSRAVLSPSPLGPPAQFAPVPVEARSEPSGVLPNADAQKVAVTKVKTAPERAEFAPATRRETRLSQASERPKGAARTRLAHRHGNPLDAQARDTRIQKWPCRSGGGGICGWQQ